MGLFKNSSFKKAMATAQKNKAAEAKRDAQNRDKATRLLKSVAEGVRTVTTTTKPGEFFLQYDIVVKNLEALMEMETSGDFPAYEFDPHENHAKMIRLYAKETNAFIIRSFKEVKAKADAISSEKGKKDLMNQWFKTMGHYIEDMEAESIDYFYALKDQYNK